MAQEIRKETDWLGREKDIIYNDGKKVGETRHETTFWGNPIDRTYDKDGNRVSETRHETTLFGTSKEVTRDTEGNKISKTVYKETICGGKKGVIYQDGNKIGELKTEKGIFGGRKQVLNKSSGEVDLTTRTIKEKNYETKEDYPSSYSREINYVQTNSRKKESRLEKKIRTAKGFTVTKPHRGLQVRVIADYDKYLARYKCDECKEEFNLIHKDHRLPVPEYQRCPFGCDNVNDEDPLLIIVKMIASFFTGKPAYEHGRLISQEGLY